MIHLIIILLMGVNPSPTEYGNDCLRCYASGTTPKLFKVFVSGVEPTNYWLTGARSPPNGYHDVFQELAFPCTWVTVPGLYPRVTFWYESGYSGFKIQTAMGVDAFSGSVYVNCETYFVNSHLNRPGYMFWKGQAWATPVVPLSNIVSSVTPMFDPEPKLECFVKPDEQAVIRYAGKRDATNISFLVDLP